jgi:hypothetical protein
MTWTKTGDEFADECWTLSDAAYRLHHEGLTWSNRKHLDGRLPKDEIFRFCKAYEAATELTDRGWWEDHDTHYQIIHQIGYQPTAASVLRRSLANQANVQKRWAKEQAQKERTDEPPPDLEYESYNESHYESQYDGDGTGRDGPGLQNATTSESVPDDFDEEAQRAFALGEQPLYDADGNPLDDEIGVQA